MDRAGTAVIFNPEPASGKSSLAQEFCRQAAAHFRDILWVACGDRSPASIAAELAEQIGGECQGDAGEAFAGLLQFAGRHRVLLVLDDVQSDLNPMIPAESQGRASMLITTRSAQARQAAQVIEIDKVPELLPELPRNPLDLRLWKAMAVCRPAGFPLELAARIAGIEAGEIPGACARLVGSRLVDPLDTLEGTMRLNAWSIAAAGDLREFRRRHAEVVSEMLPGAAKNANFNKRCIAEIMPAFRWASECEWPLASALARGGFALLRRFGRMNDAAELLVALRDAADVQGDWDVSDECAWELSWIRGVPYRGADRSTAGGDQLSFDFGG